MSSFSKLLVKAGQIRSKYIRHRNFLMLISCLVGLISALAAVALKRSVSFIEHKADSLNDWIGSNWLTAIFPLIGVGLSMLIIVYVYKNRLMRGVGAIVTAILQDKSRIPKRNIIGHLITAAVTTALGGSVGLEAPIVTSGAALGSNTAHDLRLSHRDTTLLLACGTASGIAAIFNSPFAGIIFVLEIFLLDFSIPFFIPLLMSTATATVVSQILYPEKFVFLDIKGWDMHAIPFYVVLGTVCGFISVYVTHVVEWVEGYFAKRRLDWKTWLMAGIPLCLLIFMFPRLYGEGYSTVKALMHGNSAVLLSHSTWIHLSPDWSIIIMCVLLILFKVFAASLTVSAGGNGGIFGPSLFIGGVAGFLFAFAINKSGLYELNTPNFIIAAMAGVLAGVMHAPLTSIFLLAEITGGYKLFVPLMIVSAISYFMTRKYVKHSLYHKSLFEKSILTDEHDHDHDHF
ncbi:chloride channel protein [Taibaiella soli]|uniref:Chloride channel protein n=1 Tax=Taibaiella soli TaxID=1649169 RepID=A0A2W2AFR3_9BACT|nr:chloride channel protein [Taibaiella soli]PZF74345.1 chloride channel protein [Taibaiella soli]